MTKIKQITATIITLLLLAACNGGSDSGQTNLGGSDSDGDGVRDDVGEAIDVLYATDDAQRASMEKGAKAFQNVLLSSGNASESMAEYVSSLSTMSEAEASKQLAILKSLTLNTPERQATYDAYNQLRDGKIIRVTETPAPAQARFAISTEEADTKTTHVYFGNGMLSDEVDAVLSAQYLEDAYKAELESETAGTYDFFVAYNATEGVIADTLEVLIQKQRELGIVDEDLTPYQLLQWIKAGLSENEVHALIDATPTIPVNNKSSLKEKLVKAKLEELAKAVADKAAKAIDEASAGLEVVEAEHLKFYTEDLNSSKRVIIVAHSQGCLFANTAIESIMHDYSGVAASIAVIGVASPAEKVAATQDSYITAGDDIVIKALDIFSSVLPSNLDNKPQRPTRDPRSFLNHFFLQDYFDEKLPSRDEIDADILGLAKSLPYPSP